MSLMRTTAPSALCRTMMFSNCSVVMSRPGALTV